MTFRPTFIGSPTLRGVTRRGCLRGLGATGALALTGGALAAASGKTLSVLTFNVLAGGTRRGPLQGCADLIEKSGADIIGLQEVGGSGPKLSALTGFYRFERGSKQILSRHPISEISPGRRGVKIEVPGTGGIWMFNIHFRPAPYQPYQLAGIPYGRNNPLIDSEEQAIAEADRGRGDQVAQLLDDMAPALASGLPVLLTGDFNEPSHLDWTGRAAEAKCCQIPVKWPASDRVTGAGLRDLYREVFPDEVAHRGYTWTPTPGKREVLDRIDFVYGKGVAVRSAAVVGEAEEHADIVVKPYPSDHRAVVVRIELNPTEQRKP